MRSWAMMPFLDVYGLVRTLAHWLPDFGRAATQRLSGRNVSSVFDG